MNIEFRCDGCRQFYRVKREAAGKSAVCVGCGVSMLVPTRSQRVTRVERWAANRDQHLVAADTLGGSTTNSWQRGFTFMKQSVAMAWDYKASLIPTAIAVVLCITIALLAFVGLSGSRGEDFELTNVDYFVILFPQYLIFYFCMGMTIRMVFGYLIGERVSIGQAFAAALIRLPNIVLVALVGTILDMAAQAARRNRGLVGAIAASLIELIWTTASFLIMPAIIIDGETFTGALKKTRDAFKRNIIPIGVGEVAVRGVTMLVNIGLSIVMVLLFAGLSSALSGAALLVFGITCLALWVVGISVFNIYVRTVYYASLYIWTVASEEAEAAGGRAWLPAPLAAALA